jgi:two-component system NtrC family response regulator|uniref:Sigma-54-dependent Fis family transcriptional regulator n=1 Tax=candidate division WOR-3 bacterium TaxID=2052148 RepID=A0A7C6EHZ8_UNCW3
MKLLLIEDEQVQRLLLKRILEKEGYTISEAKDGKTGIDLFTNEDFDLVLLDQRLPDMNGLEVIGKIKMINPIIPIIIITAYASVQDAVNAMKMGAFHYLNKPVEPDELILTIQKALESLNLKRENEELKRVLKIKYQSDKIIYKSEKMEKVMSLVYRAAQSDASVLITGESGTGKELVAGAIHNLSKRKERNFVITHLAALPETLIEAELFGYERGAFTGADRRRIGKFEFASGGTIFLDEIGELPQTVQVKLLRVLQEKKITHLGSNDEIPVDIRIICATNKNIEDEVKNGRFRDDLYYRLNVIRIHIPPLRERKEDIPPLVDNFIKNYAQRENKKIQGITDEAMRVITKYNFPGNIRELENIIERAIVFSRGDVITVDDLPDYLGAQKRNNLVGGKLNETIERIEREMITSALAKHNNNQTRAAEELGISERVLRYKMKKYKIKGE